MLGSSEGRQFHKGGEPAAMGERIAGRAGTSWGWGTAPQLPNKGGRAGLVPETMGRCSSRMTRQVCGGHGSG